MNAALTSATFELAGCRVVRTLGVVRGITERMPEVSEVFCTGTAVVVQAAP